MMTSAEYNATGIGRKSPTARHYAAGRDYADSIREHGNIQWHATMSRSYARDKSWPPYRAFQLGFCRRMREHLARERARAVARNCTQCGADMNPAAWILGPVCGKCCRANHRAVAGGR